MKAASVAVCVAVRTDMEYFLTLFLVHFFSTFSVTSKPVCYTQYENCLTITYLSTVTNSQRSRSVLKRQRPMVNDQWWTVNAQRSVANGQYPMINFSTVNIQRSKFSRQWSAFNRQQPTIDNQCSWMNGELYRIHLP